MKQQTLTVGNVLQGICWNDSNPEEEITVKKQLNEGEQDEQ